MTIFRANFWRPKLGDPTLWQHAPRRLRMNRSPADYPADVPRISLVTPSYNQGRFLPHTLRSVREQQYPYVEHIVIDGASTDNSRQVLCEHGQHLTYWCSEPDGGQADALNKGFVRSSGEILGYLNADDFLLPGCLHRIAATFLRHPEVDVVYGHRLLVDENNDAIGRWVLPPHSPTAYLWADFIPQETMFWRRRLWDKVGGALDESFAFAMDWELIARFHAHGARFCRIPRFLAAFRVHPAQKTKTAVAVGLAESDRVLRQLHGRRVSLPERYFRIVWYVIKHMYADMRAGTLVERCYVQ